MFHLVLVLYDFTKCKIRDFIDYLYNVWGIVFETSNSEISRIFMSRKNKTAKFMPNLEVATAEFIPNLAVWCLMPIFMV